MLAASFAAYISLIPFDFHSLSADALRRALSSLETGISSRANFLANIVLFVPVGFLGAGAFGRPSARLWRVLVVLGAAGAVSFAIEILQVFVPGRTPSLADVGAQIGGAVAGYALWWLTGEEVLRWADRLRRGQLVSSTSTLLTGYAVCRTISQLLPLDVTVSLGTLAHKYRAGGVRLIPFADVSGAVEALPDAVVSALLAVPIGMLAAVGWTRPGTRRGPGSAWLAATAFLALVEAAQVFVVSRVADVTDVLTGAAGAALGVVLAGRLTGAAAVRRAGRVQAFRPIAATFAAAVLYVLYNWSPFDFALSDTRVRERLPMLVGIPFVGYYQNSELQAISDFATKFLIATPLGIAVVRLLSTPRDLPYPRVRWLMAFAFAVAFFTTVEIGQLFLPARYPDSTDILIAAFGFVGGVWLGSQFAGRRAPSGIGN
jgi:VanZ family protein